MSVLGLRCEEHSNCRVQDPEVAAASVVAITGLVKVFTASPVDG
jgi:hypothetical protein